jgi:DNA (cytosine-5)-methyltransferase 1
MLDDSDAAGARLAHRVAASPKATFYEFFAGGGMARLGLGEDWTCLFANDFDAKKGAAYRSNFGGGQLAVKDVREVAPDELPGVADLAWGSFPCQDLSLAGAGAGLKGERSGTFYPFWDVMAALARDGRGPRIIALENVCGVLTSHGGRDFAAICQTFADAGYRCGALVVDAELFVPQSRPRLFLIGLREGVDADRRLLSPVPLAAFHTPALRRAVEALPDRLRSEHLWWRLPAPENRLKGFADLIEDVPTGVAWDAPARTRRLLAMMSPLNQAKVTDAMRAGRRVVGGLYRRTREDTGGRKVQRAEVRFDDISGCLRTPAGGSSRQMILVVEGESVRSRLISARETARLMGLPDSYRLPANYNEAYHLTGDGVAVDVVRHLARHIFEPLLALIPGAEAYPPPSRPVPETDRVAGAPALLAADTVAA